MQLRREPDGGVRFCDAHLNANVTRDLDVGAFAGCHDATTCNYDPVASLLDPMSCTDLSLVSISADAPSQASAA